MIDGNSAFVGDEDGFLVGHFRFQNAEGRGQTHFLLARVLRPNLSRALKVQLQEEINQKQLLIFIAQLLLNFYSVMNLRMCEASTTAFFNKKKHFYGINGAFTTRALKKSFKLNESLLRMFCISQQRKRNSLFFHQLFRIH